MQQQHTDSLHITSFEADIAVFFQQFEIKRHAGIIPGVFTILRFVQNGTKKMTRRSDRNALVFAPKRQGI